MLALKRAILREPRNNPEIRIRKYPLSKFSTIRLQILCWPLSIICLLILLPSSGNLPPVSPSTAPEPLAKHYQKHHYGFRAGVVFVLLSALIYPFYGIGVSNILCHIPNVNAVMVMTQAAAAVVVGLTFMNCGIFFSLITFRLDRAPELIQLLSDLAWLYFTMLLPTLLFQDLVIAAIIHSDCRERPIVPRWLGWVNALAPLGWFGAWGAYCVQDGPFAWNGAITFWLTVVSYAIHLTLNTVFFWIAAGEIEETK